MKKYANSERSKIKRKKSFDVKNEKVIIYTFCNFFSKCQFSKDRKCPICTGPQASGRKCPNWLCVGRKCLGRKCLGRRCQGRKCPYPQMSGRKCLGRKCLIDRVWAASVWPEKCLCRRSQVSGPQNVGQPRKVHFWKGLSICSCWKQNSTCFGSINSYGMEHFLRYKEQKPLTILAPNREENNTRRCFINKSYIYYLYNVWMGGWNA